MAGLLDRLYLASPIWAQQGMVAAYGWWWYQRRFSSHFHRLVAEYEGRERWSREQFRTYQEEHLVALLEAAGRSPYYRRVFAEVGVHPGLPPFETLARLPLLEKEVLRSRAKELLTETRLPRGTLVMRSSGTTGTPSEIYYTREFHALELAVPEARNLRWAGVNYHDRRVMFGVRKVCRFDQDRPPFWRFSPVERLAYASIYHLSPRFLPHYMEFLRTWRPAVVMGYPSALYTIARHALETGDLPAPARAIFTTSETVTSYAREAIETAWQARIWDRYGAVEGALFASQCEHGRYHVSPDVGIVEILKADGRPAEAGEMGEVVCTGLHNRLQPLIRYRIGDVARWAGEQECPCGRAMPILESVEGRFEDICYTRDGREMLRFDTVFKGVQGIREAQVVQERLDRFVILVVPAPGFGKADIHLIQDNMRLHAGDVETVVQPVESIPRTAAGKFRAVICRLSPEEKEAARRLGSAPPS